MRIIKRLLLKLLGGRIRLVDMDATREQEVLRAMDKVEYITEYWELQRQLGYQLYGQTQDRKYLGIVDLANTLLTIFKGFHTRPEEDQPVNNGYKSTVE